MIQKCITVHSSQLPIMGINTDEHRFDKKTSDTSNGVTAACDHKHVKSPKCREEISRELSATVQDWLLTIWVRNFDSSQNKGTINEQLRSRPDACVWSYLVKDRSRLPSHRLASGLRLGTNDKLKHHPHLCRINNVIIVLKTQSLINIY